MVLFGFPLFRQHFGCFGVLELKSNIVLLDPPNGPFYTEKHFTLKGKMSNFDTPPQKTIKQAKTPKGQMVLFSRMYTLPLLGLRSSDLMSFLSASLI